MLLFSKEDGQVLNKMEDRNEVEMCKIKKIDDEFDNDSFTKISSNEAQTAEGIPVSRMYIEDHQAEWRYLDYNIEVFHLKNY